MPYDWYYAHQNQQKGPVTEAELLSLERVGLVSDQTLVWRSGLPQWQPWSTMVAEVRREVDMARPAAAAVVGPAGEGYEVCAFSGQRRPISLMAKYGDRWVALEHKEAFLQSLREGVPVARMAGVGEPQYIGFWRRLLAFTVDFFVLLIPNILVAVPYYVMSFRKAMSQGVAGAGGFGDPLAEFRNMDAAMILAYVGSVVGGFLIAITYETWMVGRFGGTVGKLTIGARVVRLDGSRVSYWQALGRYGAKLANWLVWLVPAYGAMIIGSLISLGAGLKSGSSAEVPVALLVGVGVMMVWFVVGGFGFYMAGWTRKKQALHDKMAGTVVVQKPSV